jgi:hypothetical protein
MPSGTDSHPGFSNEPVLREHGTKQLQKRRNRTFGQRLSKKCDSLEKGIGDMTVSALGIWQYPLMSIAASRRKSKKFSSEGRALTTMQNRFVVKARQHIVTSMSTFSVTFLALFYLRQIFKERETLNFSR